MKSNYMPASVVLGIFFVLGMYIFGRHILETRKSTQYVSVKGLAEKEVQADLASWVIAASIADNQLSYVKNNINQQLDIIKKWLAERGFSDSEIKVQELSIVDNIYGQTQARYSANLQVSVSTGKVDLIDESSGMINQLIDLGVALTGDRWVTRPLYYFTKINDVKPELLAQATQAARASAEEFAQHSGSKVGGIRQASQGVISLIPGTRVNDQEEFYREKIARVVTSIDYYIE